MFRKHLISIWIGILVLSGVFLLGQETWPPSGGQVVIDAVSPYGDADGTVSGHVTGVNPSDYAVVCYVEVEDVIWSKPNYEWPHTAINEDGTWTIDITTGGSDACATRVLVFLVPTGADPVICGPCHELPTISEAADSDMVDRTPQARTIDFAGRSWVVRNSPVCRVDPGPNHFSNREEDVYVDEFGQLVMWIRHLDEKWWATEIVGEESYGYGTYRVVFNSRVDLLDPNEIGATFLFDKGAPEIAYREIDMVEYAKWGDVLNNTNSQFVVHPCSACPGCGDNCSRFQVDLSDTDMLMTVVLVWEPEGAHFWVFRGDYAYGTPPASALIHQWSKTGSEIPEPGNEKVHFNFWLLDGLGPLDGLERKMVIKDFRFESLPVCGNGVVEVGEQCDDGNTQSGDGCSSECELEASFEISGASPYGDYYGRVWGEAVGYTPESHGVAVYIKVRGGWWTKPTWSNPVTDILGDGTWECDITTGGVDYEATEIRAYLIPSAYYPPSLGGQQEVPLELEANALDWDVVYRSP